MREPGTARDRSYLRDGAIMGRPATTEPDCLCPTFMSATGVRTVGQVQSWRRSRGKPQWSPRTRRDNPAPHRVMPQ
jgi:hypothetical protein